MFPHFNSDFPKDEEYWMVAWVYLVTLSGNDYLLTVDLAAVNISTFNAHPYRADNFTSKRRTIRVGTGFLSLVEIGSIWHRQSLFFSPSTSANVDGKVSTLTITVADPQRMVSTTLQQLAQAVDRIASVHPFGSFDEELLRFSPCRVLKPGAFTLQDGEKVGFLVIPPSEILRFYHCGSGSLIQQVLAGGIPYDRIYLQEATRYDPETAELFVRIRGHLQDSDALYVGRLAGDRMAHEEAVNLGKNIRQNLVNHRVSHLDMGFPFAGPTRLKVAGKWIKATAGPHKWAFFVYAILSCTARLPFRKLLFYRENDNTQTANPQQEKQANEGIIRQTNMPVSGASVSSTSPPSSDLAKGKMGLLIAADQKFLGAPPVERVQKEQQLVALKGRRPRWHVQPSSYTVSDNVPNASDGLVGPVSTDVTDDTLPNPDAGVEFSQFHHITETLRAEKVDCLYMDGANEIASHTAYIDFPFPTQPTLSAPAIKRWLMLKTTAGTRRRRVVILQLTYGRRLFYLVECEARKSENFSRFLLASNDPFYNSELLLSTLLRQLAAAQGRWSKTDLSDLDIAKQAIHHGKQDTPQTVAQRLLGYLKRMLES
ncbi:MAG TPA: hypothetical protein VFO93_11940 [Hymenobacter sp.]|uniref:hypothetical protein n=1 Tax=Hymenobacter sp. TaxID=1898978 RepID=UPI002D7F7B84|nr:hypothetical protein [Hymenobacter sp.]HET9504245.1 hypothetical protein [Hymenobacter sp.]